MELVFDRQSESAKEGANTNVEEVSDTLVMRDCALRQEGDHHIFSATHAEDRETRKKCTRSSWTQRLQTDEVVPPSCALLLPSSPSPPASCPHALLITHNHHFILGTSIKPEQLGHACGNDVTPGSKLEAV